MGVLPIRLARATSVTTVCIAGFAAADTSTSCMRSTGLKKCMPAKFSGFVHRLGHARDRDRRGVRRENGVAAAGCGLQLAIELRLDVFIFDDGFDDDVAIGEAEIGAVPCSVEPSGGEHSVGRHAANLDARLHEFA